MRLHTIKDAIPRPRRTCDTITTEKNLRKKSIITINKSYITLLNFIFINFFLLSFILSTKTFYTYVLKFKNEAGPTIKKQVIKSNDPRNVRLWAFGYKEK